MMLSGGQTLEVKVWRQLEVNLQIIYLPGAAITIADEPKRTPAKQENSV